MKTDRKETVKTLDEKEIERELNELESSLGQLKRDYDMFFTGTEKRPPALLRQRVETSIRRYGSLQGLSYAQRFRYNSLVARFTSYQDLWTKQMRLKEEGRSPSGVIIHPDSKPKVTTQNLSHDPQKQKREELFQEYVKTREETGEGKPGVNFQKFCELLDQQQKQIIDKYHCKQVDFFVKVEAGHAKLKARPIQ